MVPALDDHRDGVEQRTNPADGRRRRIANGREWTAARVIATVMELVNRRTKLLPPQAGPGQPPEGSFAPDDRPAEGSIMSEGAP